jgi:hypothetical protein
MNIKVSLIAAVTAGMVLAVTVNSSQAVENPTSTVNAVVSNHLSSGVTLTADHTSISEGERVTFTSNAEPISAAALFVDGVFVGSGAFGALPSVGWDSFGACEVRQVVLRVYDEDFNSQVFSLDDAYTASAAVTFNSGSGQECGTVSPSNKFLNNLNSLSNPVSTVPVKTIDKVSASTSGAITITATVVSVWDYILGTTPNND